MSKQSYKIDSGLAETNSVDFNSAEEAWDTLRVKIPRRFATLYVREKVTLPVINKDEYLRKYYGKYGSYEGGKFTPTDKVPNDTSYWKPVFMGITDDPYTQPTL